MATKKLTKLQKLVNFLMLAHSNKKPVNRKAVERRFAGDLSYVVYFNGLRRNGAVTANGVIRPSKIKPALTGFRKQNRTKQLAHYKRAGANSGR